MGPDAFRAAMNPRPTAGRNSCWPSSEGHRPRLTAEGCAVWFRSPSRWSPGSPPAAAPAGHQDAGRRRRFTQAEVERPSASRQPRRRAATTPRPSTAGGGRSDFGARATMRPPPGPQRLPRRHPPRQAPLSTTHRDPLLKLVIQHPVGPPACPSTCCPTTPRRPRPARHQSDAAERRRTAHPRRRRPCSNITAAAPRRGHRPDGRPARRHLFDEGRRLNPCSTTRSSKLEADAVGKEIRRPDRRERENRADTSAERRQLAELLCTKKLRTQPQSADSVI